MDLPTRLKKIHMAQYTDQAVRLPADVLKMARLVSAMEDTTIGGLLADIARPELERRMKLHKLPPLVQPPKKQEKS